MSDAPLIAPTFLFRFAIPLRAVDPIWASAGVELPEQYSIPSFNALEGRRQYADVRGAWNAKGLTFTVDVRGKRQAPWCREDRLTDSDGLSIWIDTRDTHNIHRASRFCHRFVFLPAGGGRRLDEPVAEPVLINRARENPRPAPHQCLQVVSSRRVDGYRLAGHIPPIALTGYDPGEHPKLGFTYAVMDRELGWQTFTVDTEFPMDEDPSVWGTLELVSD